MLEVVYEAGHSSSIVCVRHPSSLEWKEVVAEGLPIAQGSALPLALGGTKGRVCLSGRLMAATVDQVEVAHRHPGLCTTTPMSPMQHWPLL